MRGLMILGFAIVPAAALAAGPPSALAQVAGGLWEVSRVPGNQAPVRQCVADVLKLAQFEHRGRNCTRSVISDKPGLMRISYSCGSAGFGQSDIQVITPRSLSISTQGISEDSPFNYVIQARRVGDCAKTPPPPPRH